MGSLLKFINSLTKCDVYVFLWCIVQLEGALHIEGAISQGIQAILLAWAVYEGSTYLLPNKRFPLILKSTSLLLLMYFVYGMVFVIFSPPYFPDVHYVYFKSFLSSFISIYLFYKYTKEGYITEDRIRIYFIIFLFVTIGQFFHYEAVLSKTAKNSQEITNNYGYKFVTLIPLTFFLYKKRLLQFSVLGIIMLFILMSVKRGAIMIGAVCFIWFLWDSIRNSTSVKHKYTTIIFSSIIIIASIATISYQLENNDYFNKRIEETEKGKTSGRDRLYTGLIDAIINDDSYIHLIFGRGAYATFDVVHKMAHNDWLETACNNGLIGVSCLLFFLYAFFRTSLSIQALVRPELRSVMKMVFFVYLTKMFFSMSLQGMHIAITMVMAYFSSIIQENKSEYKQRISI